jgi:helicase MOV-10
VSILSLSNATRLLTQRTSSSFTTGLSTPEPLIQGQPLRVNITFAPRGQRGYYEDRIELILVDSSIQQQFTITRAVRAVVGVAADYEILKPIAPYKPRARQTGDWVEPEDEGERPPALAMIKWVVPYPQAPVPQSVKDALISLVLKDRIRSVNETLLPSVLDDKTYARYYKTLLHVEEEQMQYVFFF